MSVPSCRLFIIMARDAPIAVVYRRGPRKWYHVQLWRMDTDTFEPGAWFRGRIYEDKCDLSPDGGLMIYFCHGGAYRLGYTDSWTALSRPPWLYALTLWPWGTTYGGGGRFVSNRKLVLRAGEVVTTHPDHPPQGIEVLPGSPDLHLSTSEVVGADWSGRDHTGSLVFCRFGMLIRRDEGGCDRIIADFNGLRPDPKPSPTWARVPLTSQE